MSSIEKIIRGGKLPLSIENQNDRDIFRSYHVKRRFDQNNMHHNQNIDLFSNPYRKPSISILNERLQTDGDDQDKKLAIFYVQNSNPNASYQADLKFSSLDNASNGSRLKKEKQGALFNPTKNDPKSLREIQIKAAGLNYYYGVGGGQSSYMAQGKGLEQHVGYMKDRTNSVIEPKMLRSVEQPMSPFARKRLDINQINEMNSRNQQTPNTIMTNKIEKNELLDILDKSEIRSITYSVQQQIENQAQKEKLEKQLLKEKLAQKAIKAQMRNIQPSPIPKTKKQQGKKRFSQVQLPEIKQTSIEKLSGLQQANNGKVLASKRHFSVGESFSQGDLQKVQQNIDQKKQLISLKLSEHTHNSMLRIQDPYLSEENRYLSRLKQSQLKQNNYTNNFYTSVTLREYEKQKQQNEFEDMQIKQSEKAYEEFMKIKIKNAEEIRKMNAEVIDRQIKSNRRKRRMQTTFMKRNGSNYK